MEECAADFALGAGDLALPPVFKSAGEACRIIHEFHFDNAAGAVVNLRHMPALCMPGTFGEAGLVARLKADYFNIASGMDMSVTATYRNDFNGVSSVPFTYTEGREELAVNLDFIYASSHGFGVSYVAFLTDLEDIAADAGKVELGHANADRDYASVYYKYSF